jgi:2-oxoglutarate dehydrogenase E1 component
MKGILGTSYLFGGNAPFIEELYESLARGSRIGRAEWRRWFDRFSSPARATSRTSRSAGIRQACVQASRRQRPCTDVAVAAVERKQVSVLQLINAYRFLGCAMRTSIRSSASRSPSARAGAGYYGLPRPTWSGVQHRSLVGPEQMPLREILRAVRETYCGSIGVEYMYISDVAQKRWIQSRFESIRSTPSYSPDYKRHILERVTAAETLEKYLHTRYVGQKRFSLEGGDSLIPLLDNLLQRAGEKGIRRR